jgi:hypothetical protein
MIPLLLSTASSIIVISIVFFSFTPYHFLKASNMHEYDYYASKTENNNKTDDNVTAVLKSNSIVYNFSRNNVTVSGPYNNDHTNEFKESTIALIKPTFTDAAYDNKFYNFYTKYSNVPSKANVTTDLDLLNSKITNYQSGSVNNVFAMLELIKVMKWIDHKTKVDILSDSEVDKGKIFDSKNNSNLFNVIILGHQEYVTQSEYDNLKKFVSNGGTMIILDGNVFYAEVRYFDNNNTISLVKGHGWAYNGKSAWKSIDERWKDETRDWVGSNYFCYKCVKKFKDNPFKYKAHEEQYISNPKDMVLLNYNPVELQNTADKNTTIATYELKYGRGTVISMGIYSDDIIHNGKFDRFFDNLIVKYALHSDTK